MSRTGSVLDAGLNMRQVRGSYRWLSRVYGMISLYEEQALRELRLHGDFSSARSVYDFGCGNGQFALSLLRDHLPDEARYCGVDVSADMLNRAEQKLRAYAQQLELHHSLGGPPPRIRVAEHDRFVCNFVLDVLPEEDIRQTLLVAHELLRPQGKLCLASLAPGSSVLSRPVMALWKGVYKRAPGLLGGCRPLSLTDYLPAEQWQLHYQNIVEPVGVPLEIVVAVAQ